MAGRLLLLVVAGLWFCPAPAAAQYFGQNKVQYERFDYHVLTTEHFDIYHYAEATDAVAHAARLVERWRTTLTGRLGFGLPGRQPLVLYASHPHFTQTQVIGELIGDGTGGVTESLKRRMALPFAGSLSETSHVLGHELVHAFQYGAGGERAGALPLWFIEGMAEYLSLGNEDAHTAGWLRDLAQRETLPGFAQLNDPRYFPYRAGHAAWAYLASRFGEDVVGTTYLDAAQTGDPIGAIERATGMDIDVLSGDWHAAIRTTHGERPGDATPGPAVIAGSGRGGAALNVSPALSPDGRWLAYLSERDLFSIDVYIADTATGDVIERLTASDTDPHIESLNFTASAGAWDSASRRFAFTTVTRGRASLTIVDMASNRRRRSLALPAVDQAWHPSWAPDGRTIVLSGLSGGVSDLYAIDVETAAVQQLTDDAFADLQPSWSPDGRSVAFITDRFTSSLEQLTFGDLRLATLTLANRRVEPVAGFDAGLHLNPQWHRDGKSLFFVGAPDGAPNVYRVHLDTGATAQLTSVTTAVSGITGRSPALSYAPGSNQLAFSVLREGGYDIHVIAAERAGPPVTARTDLPSRAVLFPGAAARAQTSLSLPGGPGGASPALAAAPVTPYRPHLTLDLAGAAGGVGVSGRYGATFGGGAGMQFSDMLGDHTLGMYLSANGGIRDIGGQALYVNRRSRWNWGAAALVLPYTSGTLAQWVETTADNRRVLRDEEMIYRQTEMELRGLVAYPFSRALRVEFQAGGRRLAFSREAYTRVFDFSSGELLGDDRTDLEAPSALVFGEASAALVYDQSVFGPTSPIGGQRYRFEAAPSVGSLRFTSVTLDYRRYQRLIRPVTLAVRGMHLARYGGGGEDPRLATLFLGYPALVRGYDAGSFDTVNDCDGVTRLCPDFEALFGSRLLLGNAELRFPLVGLFTGEYRYGPVPIEGFLFADAGVAWTSTNRPSFAGGDRGVVRSAGAGVRVNAFGYAIVELALARPLDRARSGWVFSFNLRPGF